MHAQQSMCHHICKRRDCSSEAWLELAAFLTFSENTNILFLISCLRVICTTLSKSKSKAEAPRQFQDDSENSDKAEQVLRNARDWAVVKKNTPTNGSLTTQGVDGGEDQRGPPQLWHVYNLTCDQNLKQWTWMKLNEPQQGMKIKPKMFFSRQIGF